METAPRYEIVDTIAAGDFAIVYRARDRELRREVAIKQIHQQFLSDPRQLERYWNEAQLLASLQHPNILTIYDIVRPRGWLILELMRGSLKQNAEGEPVDLDYLRTVLTCCLNALHLLHTNGVIHGDVKPSNMLVDMQNRIKLGDFGLARRASSEEGSLLKGTTKYMAPELVSNQFGPVGPASDLYSLGFSAYELMCAAQFESLFPGLSTFGRDKQIAWMMWHVAADRNLPEIGRVLEGVPDDLTRVIQKLVKKDQALRYQSAAEVLGDLRPAPPPIAAPEEFDLEAQALKAEEAKRKRRLRIGAAVAVVCSIVLCAFMLLPRRPPSVHTTSPEATRGVIRNVYADERKIALELHEDGRPKEITVKPRDHVMINNRASLLRDLWPGDEVVVNILRDQSGHRITEILAFRPETHKGHITSIKADQGQFTLVVEEGDDEGRKIVISVSRGVQILFNGKKEIEGRPVALRDLRVDDRVVVRHAGSDTGRTAVKIEVQRVVTFEGVVRDLNAIKGTLTVAQDKSGSLKLITLPFTPGCEVTVNGRRIMNEKLLRPTDLRPGDKVKVARDTQIVRVDADRVLGQTGVIRKIDYSTGTIEVMLDSKDEPTVFLVGSDCTISLGGEAVTLGDLRAGDGVEVTHESLNARYPEALTVAATRPSDPTRWAILVGIQDYDDHSLSHLDYPVANAKLLRGMLVKRCGVPEDQALLLADVSLVRLEQGIAGLLGRTRADNKVIIYIAGHAYQNAEGIVYLAPKNFDLKRTATTGLKLQTLADQFDRCLAREKLLLLDCCHAGEGEDLKMQPSTAEMVRSLDTVSVRSPFRTVTAIASCSRGGRGYDWPAKEYGLFAYCLSEGFSGRADKNRDNRLEPTELFAFLNRAMASAGSQVDRVQTPVLFLPDPEPPRLSEAAKKAIRKLASFLRQDKIDVDAAAQQYATAAQLARKELEPRLLYGLVLLKAKKRSDALSHFEELKAEHPNLLFPLDAIVWLRFEKRTYQAGIDELTELVSKISKPARPTDSCPPEMQHIFFRTGQLREFAATAAQEGYRPSDTSLEELDATVAEYGDQARQLYEQGRAQTRGKVSDFDKRIKAATDEPTRLKLQIERRQLLNYCEFPLNELVHQILAHLDR